MSMTSRVVVGGGLAGLLAALRASDRGERVTVLESAPRPGGLIRSESLSGVWVDVGAESFATTTPAMFRLIDELGLEAEREAPQRTDAHIVAADGTHSRIPHGIFGIPASLDDPDLAGAISAPALVEARRRDVDAVALEPDATVADL
ncbi:MAG TPA: FAD-dependent oxidoreductase, partial [Microbacteriaceae bacterium]|nr:FAD-dependent oxidoreductase [Microbacteriaceae bacterium]